MLDGLCREAALMALRQDMDCQAAEPRHFRQACSAALGRQEPVAMGAAASGGAVGFAALYPTTDGSAAGGGGGGGFQGFGASGRKFAFRPGTD